MIYRRLVSALLHFFICWSLLLIASYLVYLNYGNSKIIVVGVNSYLYQNKKETSKTQKASSPYETPTERELNNIALIPRMADSSAVNTTASGTTTTAAAIATDTIATAIHSNVTTNEDHRACVIPKLSVDDPEIQEFLQHYGPMECSPVKDWVYTADGKFYIDDEATKNYTMVTCDYYDIIRVDDSTHREELTANFTNGSEVLGDGFRVFCTGNDADDKLVYYTNFHFGVPKIIVLHDAQPPQRDHLINSHVFMYLFDSLSRINFIRKLPNFYQLLTEEFGAIVLEGYNIVGDGTPWAVIPMTTGFYQPELPESRKRFDNASYLDDWPFIWRDFRNAGFATTFLEEQAIWGPFWYKIKGFQNKPVDHYPRAAIMYADTFEANHYCLGDKPKSIVLVNYWKQLISVYEKINRKTFSFMCSGETSHESYNYVQSLDEHMVNNFRQLYNEGFFKNTFLFILADHGRRFGPVRQTQSGRLEEKLPMLAIVPPPWFKKKFPKSYSNLKNNKDTLVTAFDIYATLKHLIDFKKDGEIGDLSERGISLFKKIPITRTCKHASIKPHFCSCLDWTKIDDLNNATVRNITYFVLDRINEMLNDAKGLCAILTLKKLNSARILKPNDDLLSFVESVDFDNFSHDLSGNKTLSSAIYQIVFTTSPNDGVYDVSVTHFFNSNQYVINMDEVSRLNQYGNQSKCIHQTQQHLRQYCYCKH